MNFIKLVKDILGKAEKALLVALLSGAVLLSFLQVILREFFSGGLLWADIFLRHLVLWLGFLGAAIATEENKHFAIDVARKKLPEKAKRYAEIFISLFALACLVLLSDSAWKFYKDELENKTVLFNIGNLEVFAYWVDVIIPAGFILLTIHFALNFFEQVLTLIHPSSVKGSEL